MNWRTSRFREKLTCERATWEAHARSWRNMLAWMILWVSRGYGLLAKYSRNFLFRGSLSVTFLPFTRMIYTIITHKSMRGHSEKKKTLDRFFTTHAPIFWRESYPSFVRNHCSLFLFSLLLLYIERRFVPKHNPHIFRV